MEHTTLTITKRDLGELRGFSHTLPDGQGPLEVVVNALNRRAEETGQPPITDLSTLKEMMDEEIALVWSAGLKDQIGLIINLAMTSFALGVMEMEKGGRLEVLK